MITKASPIRRAIKAFKHAMEPHGFQVSGKSVVCSICEHDRFEGGGYIALLMMHTLICDNCGHVEFFKKKPESI